MKLKILITNDDGIESFSTGYLANRLVEKGHDVTVVVPMENMSGIGTAISLKKQLFSTKINENTISIIGTPCDCINIVSSGQLVENNFDLVISGVNYGENAGASIRMSGTVSAAYSAKCEGYKALALSYADQEASDKEMSICVDYLVELMENNEMFMEQPGYFFNINVPKLVDIQDSETAISMLQTSYTYVGKGRYNHKFMQESESSYRYDNALEFDNTSVQDGCDYDALKKGLVSISKIHI